MLKVDESSLSSNKIWCLDPDLFIIMYVWDISSCVPSFHLLFDATTEKESLSTVCQFTRLLISIYYLTVIKLKVIPKAFKKPPQYSLIWFSTGIDCLIKNVLNYNTIVWNL